MVQTQVAPLSRMGFYSGKGVENPLPLRRPPTSSNPAQYPAVASTQVLSRIELLVKGTAPRKRGIAFLLSQAVPSNETGSPTLPVLGERLCDDDGARYGSIDVSVFLMYHRPTGMLGGGEQKPQA